MTKALNRNPRPPFGLAAAAALALLFAAPMANAQMRDLSDLHAALHLTPAQESAWRAFAAANAPDPADDARHRNAEMLAPTITSPRRVDLAAAVMQTDLDELKRRGEAIKAFYAVLSPEQRAIFDRETRPRQG